MFPLRKRKPCHVGSKRCFGKEGEVRAICLDLVLRKLRAEIPTHGGSGACPHVGKANALYRAFILFGHSLAEWAQSKSQTLYKYRYLHN